MVMKAYRPSKVAAITAAMESGCDRGSRDHGGCDHGDRRRLCSHLGERSEASTTRRRLVKFTESVKLLVKFIDMAGRIRWNAIWSMEEGNKETTRQAAAEIRSLISRNNNNDSK